MNTHVPNGQSKEKNILSFIKLVPFPSHSLSSPFRGNYYPELYVFYPLLKNSCNYECLVCVYIVLSVFELFINGVYYILLLLAFLVKY